MKRTLAAIVVILGLTALAAALFTRARPTGYLTDGASINEPADAARPRQVLWSPAEPAGPSFATADEERQPRWSPDGRTLFFARTGADGQADLWHIVRTADGWSDPAPIDALNTRANELAPEPSADGRYLYFASDREDGSGGLDLWLAEIIEGRFQPPINLGPRINTPFDESGAALTPDGSLLFFSTTRLSRGGLAADASPEAPDAPLERSADHDIFRIVLDDPEARAEHVAALSSDGHDGAPDVSPYGDFIYFASDRAGGHGGLDLYRAPLRHGEPGAPENLGPAVNTGAHELDPAVSWGGFRLHFASDRGGGDEVGRLDHDLYVSTSREVRLEHDRAVARFDRGTLLLALWWVLLIVASVALLWVLWRMLRNAKIGPASLIARCLLASMIVHVLLMLLFTIWHVGSALSDRWRPGSAVRLVTAAPADGTGLASQVRGGLTAVQFSPRELASEVAMVTATITAPAPVERADTPSAAPPPAEAMARTEAFEVRGPKLDLEPTRPADAPSEANAALPPPPVPTQQAGAETAVTAPEAAVALSSSAAPRPTPAPAPRAVETPAPRTDVSAQAEAEPNVPARAEPAPAADPAFTAVEVAAAAPAPPAPADAAPVRAGQDVAVTPPAAPVAASPRSATADAPRAIASADARATAPSIDVAPAPVVQARATDAPDRPMVDAPPAAAPAPVVSVGVPVPADAVRAARTGETDAQPSAALAARPSTTPVDDATAPPRPAPVRAPSAVTGGEGSAPPRPLTAPDLETPPLPESAERPPAALAALAPAAPPLPAPRDGADRTPIAETPADPTVDALPRAAAARAREAAPPPAPDVPTTTSSAPRLAQATTPVAPRPLPAPAAAPPVPTDDLPAPPAPSAPAAALAADLPAPSADSPAAPARPAEEETTPAWPQLATAATAPLVDVADAPGARPVEADALSAAPAADLTVRPLAAPDAVTAAPPDTAGSAPPALLAAAPSDGPALPAPTDLGAPDAEPRKTAETPTDVDVPPLQRAAAAVPDAAPGAHAPAPSPLGVPLDAVAAASTKRAWDAPPPATAVPDAIVALPAPTATAEIANVPVALAPPGDLPLTYDAARGTAAPSASAASDVPLAAPAALATAAPDNVPAAPAAPPPLLPRAAPDARPLTETETPRPDLAPPTMLAESTPLEPLAPPTTPLATLPLPTETEMPKNPFEHRKPERRRELVAKTGGTPETEAAVAAALAWLASVQRPDGRWDGESFGARAPVDTALTGLSILCYLAADHTHVYDGPYRKTVELALDWLIARQDDRGSFLGRESMYSHAIATIAIAEAYGMSGDAGLRDHVRDATAFIVDARHSRTGGWRYAPGQFGDTSVLGWQIMALTSARKTGIEVPDEAFETGRRWLNRVASGDGRYAYQPGQEPSPAMTAESMFVWQLLGRKDTDRTMRASADYLLANPPRWHESSSTYYWYYATLALYQHQDHAWNRWNRRVRDVLVSAQRQDGTFAGSWDPLDRWAETGGRVYQTAICTLTLEVYYRYLPLFMEGE